MKNIMYKAIYKINAFFADEKGAETAEWAVIVGLLIAIGLVVYAPAGPIGAAIGGVGGRITAALGG